jgi:hypothetical protein
MPYEVSWYVPDKVLMLSVVGDYTMQDARQANRIIVEKLSQSRSPMLLLIDANKMRRPYNFQELRTTQTYMDHNMLKRIVVVADDRLVMLAMMVIFNLGHAYLSMFNDFEKANVLLEREAAKIG